jgi:ribosomal protein L32
MIKMVKCQYCGVEIELTNSVCSNCGEAEPVPTAQSEKSQMDEAKARINAVFRSIRAIHEADKK